MIWSFARISTRANAVDASFRRPTDACTPSSSTATRYSMIHADLHEENLFVSNDGLIVIDFDDSGFGWHQYDLAVALFAYSDRSDFDAIQNALVEGYRTRRDLSDEDLSLLELFVLVRTLALIGWANARPEIGRDAEIRSRDGRGSGSAH